MGDAAVACSRGGHISVAVRRRHSTCRRSLRWSANSKPLPTRSRFRAISAPSTRAREPGLRCCLWYVRAADRAGTPASTAAGCGERATTTVLNASLLAVLQDFIFAVRRAWTAGRIHRAADREARDGSVDQAAVAPRTPVETIHSGPAASAIGGRFFSGLDDALVVDIGGTTTDLALIENGQVTVSVEGATVGEYKTSSRLPICFPSPSAATATSP